MSNWISLKTFSNYQAATATKMYLECHGVLTRITPDDVGHTRLLVPLVQTEKAQRLIHP